MRVLVAFALLLAACASTQATDAAPTAPAAEPLPALGDFEQTSITLRAPTGGDSVPLRVYDAADGPSRQRGLMQVTELPDDAGMLFRFATDSSGGFWMKDTVLPLSIAFAGGDGRIIRILDMEPCKADPCEVYDPGAVYRLALEVPQGAFDRWGVTEGWRIEVPADLPAPTA